MGNWELGRGYSTNAKKPPSHEDGFFTSLALDVYAYSLLDIGLR